MWWLVFDVLGVIFIALMVLYGIGMLIWGLIDFLTES